MVEAGRASKSGTTSGCTSETGAWPGYESGEGAEPGINIGVVTGLRFETGMGVR